MNRPRVRRSGFGRFVAALLIAASAVVVGSLAVDAVVPPESAAARSRTESDLERPQHRSLLPEAAELYAADEVQPETDGVVGATAAAIPLLSGQTVGDQATTLVASFIAFSPAPRGPPSLLAD